MNLSFTGIQGLIVTLILLGVSSAILFRYIPTPDSYKNHTNPKYFFTLSFITIAFAFFTYALQPMIPKWLSVIFTHNMYILGMYFIIFGLKQRQRATKHVISYKKAILHLTLVNTVNIGIFYFYIPNVLIRTLLLNANIIFLMFYSLNYLNRKDTTFKRGEKIFKVVMLTCIGITCISPLVLIVSETIETYFSYSVMLQSVQMHIVFGALCLLILSDVADLHYKNSVTDAMTGIFNRRYFIQKTDTLINKLKNNNDGSLIICDIDNFKRINDTYGHDTGDKVIVQFSRILSKIIRKDDILARIGGEEFAIYLPHTDKKTAESIAERMRSCTEVMTLNSRKSGEIKYTASFGVAYLRQTNTITTLMTAADNALYCAKNTGRNCVCVFTGSIKPSENFDILQDHTAPVLQATMDEMMH